MSWFQDALLPFIKNMMLPIIVAMIVFIANIVKDYHIKNQNKAETVNKWYTCLRKSCAVDKSLKKLEDLFKWKYQLTFSRTGIRNWGLLWLLIMFFFIIAFSKTSNLIFVIVMLIGNLVPLYLSKDMDIARLKKYRDCEVEYKKQINRKHYTDSALFYIDAYGLYYVYHVCFNVHLQGNWWTIIIWIVSTLLGLKAYRRSKENTKLLYSKLKEKIEEQYKVWYPVVEINSPNARGKLNTVFDEKFIVLTCGEHKIYCSFEAINYLKIKE